MTTICAKESFSLHLDFPYILNWDYILLYILLLFIAISKFCISAFIHQIFLQFIAFFFTLYIKPMNRTIFIGNIQSYFINNPIGLMDIFMHSQNIVACN